jgi:hypothetical protein
MIWLDMDGPLADFDGHYFAHFGVHPTRWPEPETVDWKLVQSVPDFYLTIPLAEGARDLFRYVVEHDPDHAILTGIPKSITASDNHKTRWAAREFPGERVQCCSARDKWQFGEPGDVLVDDYTKYRVDWERMGGIFVHHTSAADSIRRLGELLSCGAIGEDL